MDHKDYQKFRQQLLDSTIWPTLYMFKFIIPNNQQKLDAVKQLFDSNTKFSYKTSRDIRFIGITVKQTMQTPDQVLDIYSKAQKIEGLIAL